MNEQAFKAYNNICQIYKSDCDFLLKFKLLNETSQLTLKNLTTILVKEDCVMDIEQKSNFLTRNVAKSGDFIIKGAILINNIPLNESIIEHEYPFFTEKISNFKLEAKSVSLHKNDEISFIIQFIVSSPYLSSPMTDPSNFITINEKIYYRNSVNLMICKTNYR